MTRWGPVTGADREGRPLAIMWTAMQPNGLNLGHLRLGRAMTAADALEAAAAMRGPQQNVVIADRHGSIAWTISGYLPERFGPPEEPFDGTVPAAWTDGRRGWRGEQAESLRPRVLNPPSGLIVTANQRTLPLAAAERIGRMWAGPERAFRIRALLEGLVDEGKPVDERACAAIQLDVRSPRLVAWRDAIVAALERSRMTRAASTPSASTRAASTPAATLESEASSESADSDQSVADRAERVKRLDAALRLLSAWDGLATVDSKAIGVISRTRELLTAAVARAWTETALLDRQPALAPAERASLAATLARRWPDDEAVLRLLEARPDHLLPPSAPTWDALVEETLLASITELRTKDGLPRWGTINMSSIAHPLARAAPILASTFSIPAHEQPGHWSTVRVASPRFGASNRLVVTPGRESAATLTTPAGQSANPSSRHYADLHPFWRDGEPAPLLAGSSVMRWTLVPVAIEPALHERPPSDEVESPSSR
jgi:penicillin amidase